VGGGPGGSPRRADLVADQGAAGGPGGSPRRAPRVSDQAPDPGPGWPDVASRALGGSVLYANDDFFADARQLIDPRPAAHDPAAFGPRGKLYDGWETRRRRGPGDDFAIIRLAAPAVVRGVHIDTAYFRGNYPPAASVEGTMLLGHPPLTEVLAAGWVPLTGVAELAGDQVNPVPVTAPDQLVSHVKLRIYPDGGVARLRVSGEIVPDPRWLGGRVDLAALRRGGRVVACSNMFYAEPANVLAPGRARSMSEGWETARRRDAGHDWLVARLAAPGRLHHAVLDTSWFLGNAPGAARLADADTGTELLPRTALQPDTEHRFRLADTGPVRQVRLDIYPDGGLARLRLAGEVDEASRAGVAGRWLGLLPPAQAAAVQAAPFFT
jgi:allantoicase